MTTLSQETRPRHARRRSAAADWPAWTDAHRWEPTEPGPTADDITWATEALNAAAADFDTIPTSEPVATLPTPPATPYTPTRTERPPFDERRVCELSPTASVYSLVEDFRLSEFDRTGKFPSYPDALRALDMIRERLFNELVDDLYRTMGEPEQPIDEMLAIGACG